MGQWEKVLTGAGESIAKNTYFVESDLQIPQYSGAGCIGRVHNGSTCRAGALLECRFATHGVSGDWKYGDWLEKLRIMHEAVSVGNNQEKILALRGLDTGPNRSTVCILAWATFVLKRQLFSVDEVEEIIKNVAEPMSTAAGYVTRIQPTEVDSCTYAEVAKKNNLFLKRR